MMGQGTGQRSTLSLNHAAYYIDTTLDCTTQGGCPTCAKFDPNGFCEADSGPYRPSVFLAGRTYYVYFVYASPTLQQSYDIYVGPGTSDAELKVTPIFVDAKGYKIGTADDPSFIKPANPTNQYYDGKSLLRLKVDLTGQDSAFKDSKPKFCNPKAFCSAKDDGSCGCNAASTACSVVTDADCAWASNDIDCPIDPMNANGMRCFGFSFTMPPNYTAKPVVPSDSLFVPFTDNPYFAKGNVTFQGSEKMSPHACITRHHSSSRVEGRGNEHLVELQQRLEELYRR